MAVTLTSPTFGQTIFAKNQVVFQLRSLGDLGEAYAAQGANSKLSPGFVGQFASGETMTITYTEPDGTSESVIFTAGATYAGEAEIPDDSIGGSMSTYWEIIRTKVAAHHRIAPYFKITRSNSIIGQTLLIKALDSDPGWEIEVTNTAGISVINSAATLDTTPPNYTVLFEVYFEKSYKLGDYALVAQLKNTPDSDGYLYFDISSVLEAECKAALDEPVVPVWNTTDSIPGNNLRRFYIRYTESYGAPIVAQDWEYDEVRTCMNGGISQSIFALGDWFDGLNVDNALLTWMPDGRTVGMNQPEFIAFYNWDSVARSVFVRVRWYDISDNAISTPEGKLTALELAPGEVAYLPVGPKIMGMDAHDEAYKYQVQVVYNGVDAYEPLSQWRTYFLDRDYYHSNRYIQYLNGFGTPECWRCTGVFAKRIDIQRTIAELPLLAGATEYSSDRFQFAATFKNQYTYRTGYMRRIDAESLQELLVSGEVYDVSAAGYTPLVLDTNSFEITNTEENLHSYQFTATPRLESRNFSQREDAPVANDAWQDPDGIAWEDPDSDAWTIP